MEVKWRRNHIAHTIGGVMLIHGGILENERITNELILLEYSTLKWSVCSSKGKSPYLAFHCSEFVLENEKTTKATYHIYKGSPMEEGKNYYKIKYEGIYLFGGIDEECNMKDDINILKIGRKPCEWIKPCIIGQSPPPRIHASLNFYHELNILIMHGGRNDKLKKSIFSDIWIFDLENYFWIKASTAPINPRERTEHSAILYNNKILILGGLNLRKFNPMDFFILNVDMHNNRMKEREILKDIEKKNKNEKSKVLNDQNILEGLSPKSLNKR